MNDCSHSNSLVPCGNESLYICTKCGWKFRILHVEDNFKELVKKVKNRITNEDIELVSTQTGASYNKSFMALMESHGDIAKAILKLLEKP